MFYDIFKQLCNEKRITPTKASAEIGFSKGSVSYWKRKYIAGEDVKPDSYTAEKMANYFGVSVDFLLGRATESDNLVLNIPKKYIDAANGDEKMARAMMLAAERDVQRSNSEKGAERFSQQDADLIFALWGNTDDIDEKDLDDVKKFAAFIKEQKKNK